jgi:hypothetical protein
MRAKEFINEDWAPHMAPPKRAMAYHSDDVPEDPPVTQDDLNQLAASLDNLWKAVGVDVEFTRHFLDRVNDPRNGEQVTIKELTKLFREQYRLNGKKIAQMGPDAEAVLKDMQTNVNVPFVLNWDRRNQELDLVAKTVMRKKNFGSSTPIIRI